MSDSKCKSNVVSHSVLLNTTVEQLYRLGEDNCNDGLDAILALLIIPEIFCPFLGPRQFPVSVGFYSNSLISPWSWIFAHTHAHYYHTILLLSISLRNNL
jgi:hypothetical protein